MAKKLLLLTFLLYVGAAHAADKPAKSVAHAILGITFDCEGNTIHAELCNQTGSRIEFDTIETTHQLFKLGSHASNLTLAVSEQKLFVQDTDTILITTPKFCVLDDGRFVYFVYDQKVNSFFPHEKAPSTASADSTDIEDGEGFVRTRHKEAANAAAAKARARIAKQECAIADEKEAQGFALFDAQFDGCFSP